MPHGGRPGSTPGAAIRRCFVMRINEFIEKYGIHYKQCNKMFRNPNMPDWKNADHWEVVLHTPGKGINEFATYYSMGYGHEGKKPTMQQVLDSVASDAAGYEDSGSFEEWAMNYGYDPDSRKAEKIYRLVEQESRELKTFLGNEAYESLLRETERM